MADWKKVESSMFEAVSYDEAHGVLGLKFKTGTAVYALQDVPPEVFDEFISQQSLGKYYLAHLKGKYETLKLPEAETPPQFMEAPSVPKETYQLESVDKWEKHPHGGLVGLNASGDKIAYCSEEGSFDGPIVVSAPAVEDDPTWEEPAASLVVQKPVGEVLPPLTPPKTPEEALLMLGANSGEIQAVISQNKQIAADALKLAVVDGDSYTAAGERMKSLVVVMDRSEAWLEPIRAVLYVPYQLAQKRKKEALESLEQAVDYLKRRRQTWFGEQERIRLEEQRRLQREAEEQAERERKKRSEEMTMAEVEASLQIGDEDTAQLLFNTPIQAAPVYVPPVRVEPTIEQTRGISSRQNWKAMIIDYPDKMDNFEALILDVASGIEAMRETGNRGGHASSNVLLPNKPALNALAKAQKKTLQIPGVHAYDAGGESVRRSKR